MLAASCPWSACIVQSQPHPHRVPVCAARARDFPPLVLDVPCALFTITTRDLPLAAEVGGANPAHAARVLALLRCHVGRVCEQALHGDIPPKHASLRHTRPATRPSRHTPAAPNTRHPPQVGRALRFAPQLKALADQVVEGILAKGVVHAAIALTVLYPVCWSLHQEQDS